MAMPRRLAAEIALVLRDDQTFQLSRNQYGYSLMTRAFCVDREKALINSERPPRRNVCLQSVRFLPNETNQSLPACPPVDDEANPRRRIFEPINRQA
jgi:hypothetical protein